MACFRPALAHDREDSPTRGQRSDRWNVKKEGKRDVRALRTFGSGEFHRRPLDGGPYGLISPASPLLCLSPGLFRFFSRLFFLPVSSVTSSSARPRCVVNVIAFNTCTLIASERSVRVMLDVMGILHGTSIEPTIRSYTGWFRGTGAWRIAIRYFRQLNEL